MGQACVLGIEEVTLVPEWLSSRPEPLFQGMTFINFQPIVRLRRDHPDFARILHNVRTAIADGKPLAVEFDWDARELLQARPVPVS